MFKVNSKGRPHWHRSGVFIANFQNISHCSSLYIVNFEHVIPGCEDASKT